jgi:hypothetical protein
VIFSRKDFIVSKVVKNAEDEEDDEFTPEESKNTFSLLDCDPDWVEKNEEDDKKKKPEKVAGKDEETKATADLEEGNLLASTNQEIKEEDNQTITTDQAAAAAATTTTTEEEKVPKLYTWGYAIRRLAPISDVDASDDELPDVNNDDIEPKEGKVIETSIIGSIEIEIPTKKKKDN